MFIIFFIFRILRTLISLFVGICLTYLFMWWILEFHNIILILFIGFFVGFMLNDWIKSKL